MKVPTTKTEERELEELVDDHEERAAEDKWRAAAVKALRAEADRLEAGGRFGAVYYELGDEECIEAADDVRHAVKEFSESGLEGDVWGLCVPIRWRVLEERGPK